MVNLFGNQKIKTFTLVFIIFLTALTLRLFIWQDYKFEAEKVQSGVAFMYRHGADCILKEGLWSHFDKNSCISNLDIQGHPRGYPILLSFIFYFFGNSNGVIQIFSLLVNCLSAVFIFFISRELLTENVAFLTGFSASFSPSFSLNSIYLLPDTLSIFPILAAMLFLVKAYKEPNLRKICLVGFFIGISCWLRANTLLLAPFLALVFPFIFSGKAWIKYALAMVSVSFLVISPMTIRNAVVYNSFIPVSLGSGQTLLEGIGDYDREKRFGIPKTDVEICQMEAKEFNRPDYANTLFGEDGIERDKMRVQKGFQVIKENPFWFAGVMFRRALWMTNLEKSDLISTNLPVAYSPQQLTESPPNITFEPTDIKSKSKLLNDLAKIELIGQNVLLTSDENKNDNQVEIAKIQVKPYFNSVLRLRIKFRQGRIKILVKDDLTTYFSTILQIDEGYSNNEQNEQTIDLPFVSKTSEVKIVIKNEVTSITPTLTEISTVQLFELGETTTTWQKSLRILFFGIQKLFITPVFLLFEIIGIIILLKRKNKRILLLLLVVPFYYFCVQSILHTEFRYVLTIHYFLFALFSLGLIETVTFIFGMIYHRSSFKTSER